MEQLNYQCKIMFKTMVDGQKQFLRYNSAPDTNGFSLVSEDSVDRYCIFQINEENPNNTDNWCYSGNQDANTNGAHGNFRINCPMMPSDYQVTSVNFDNRSNLTNVGEPALYAGIGQGPAEDYETFLCFDPGNLGNTGPISDGDTVVIRNLNTSSSDHGFHRQYLSLSTGSIYAICDDPGSATQFVIEEVNWSTWMTDVKLTNRKLTDILIPGTHDSGSYSLTDAVPSFAAWYLNLINTLEKLAPGDAIYDYVRRWSKTQTVDIEHQLLMGARYLDLRVCEYEGSFHTHHGMVGTTITDIFAQINAFMNLVSGSNEVLIIRAGHMDNMDGSHHTAFVQKIKDELGNYLYYRPAIDSNIGDDTIGTITAHGPAIIVIYDDPIFNTSFTGELAIWGMNQIVDAFEGVTSVGDLMQQRTELAQAGTHAPALTELQWILTPPDSGVAQIKGLFTSPHNLVDFSQGCNSAFSTFYTQQKMVGNPLNFVIITDFIADSSVVIYAIEASVGVLPHA